MTTKSSATLTSALLADRLAPVAAAATFDEYADQVLDAVPGESRRGVQVPLGPPTVTSTSGPEGLGMPTLSPRAARSPACAIEHDTSHRFETRRGGCCMALRPSVMLRRTPEDARMEPRPSALTDQFRKGTRQMVPLVLSRDGGNYSPVRDVSATTSCGSSPFGQSRCTPSFRCTY
jgi:hypothetical protein